MATTKKGNHYTEGIGRRKTAVARVRLTSGKGVVTVNGKELKEYFPVERLASMAAASLKEVSLLTKYDVSARVNGGGIASQAEAIRHGAARALVKINEALKKPLRAADMLTRDSRMVERKKYGLKKARRAPQWQKR
jgi:small subunit ribosomal protein S9